MILRWPGRIPAGGVIDTPFSEIDLYPTLTGLCGVPAPPGVQGVDHSDELCGRSDRPARDAVLLQWLGRARYGFADFQYRGLRTERYTYVKGAPAPALCVLYDNEQDPYQLENLFDRPEARALQNDLHDRLRRAVLRSGDMVPAVLDAPSGAGA